MYKALVLFRDTQDKDHVYQPGDTYPREGYTPSKERVELLLSDQNRQGRPVIAEEEPSETAEEPSETLDEPAEEEPADEKPKRGRKKSE